MGRSRAAIERRGLVCYEREPPRLARRGSLGLPCVCVCGGVRGARRRRLAAPRYPAVRMADARRELREADSTSLRTGAPDIERLCAAAASSASRPPSPAGDRDACAWWQPGSRPAASGGVGAPDPPYCTSPSRCRAVLPPAGAVRLPLSCRRLGFVRSVGVASLRRGRRGRRTGSPEPLSAAHGAPRRLSRLAPASAPRRAPASAVLSAALAEDAPGL